MNDERGCVPIKLLFTKIGSRPDLASLFLKPPPLLIFLNGYVSNGNIYTYIIVLILPFGRKL